MPRRTPFHSRTAAICQGSRWEDWSGFLSASTYELDHFHEYNAVRLGCGLFDVSPLYKYDVRGRDAEALLDALEQAGLSIPNEVRDLAHQVLDRSRHTETPNEES